MTAHDLMKAHSAAYAAWSVALRRGDAIEPLTFPRVVVGQRRCPDGGLQDVYATSAGEIDEAFAPRINVARTKLRDPKVALSFEAQRDRLKRELVDLETAYQFEAEASGFAEAERAATAASEVWDEATEALLGYTPQSLAETAQIAAHILVFERFGALPTGAMKRLLRSLARAGERSEDDHRHAA